MTKKLTLQHQAGWLTLLNGIHCIDQMATRRGRKFAGSLKPEVLEQYVTDRKEDMYYALRHVAAGLELTEEQFAVKVARMTLPDVAAACEHYDTGLIA